MKYPVSGTREEVELQLAQLPEGWVELLGRNTRTVPSTPLTATLVQRGLQVRFGEDIIALEAAQMGDAASADWFLAQESFDGILGVEQLIDRGNCIVATVVLRVARTRWLREHPDLWEVDDLGFVICQDNIMRLAYAPLAFAYETDITLPVEGVNDGVETVATKVAATTIMDPLKRTLARRHFLQRRDKQDADVAFEAFDKLFTYYSLHEELDRLRLMMKQLPYALEEDPRMERYRELLEVQVGHLALEQQGGAFDWYAHGSPSEVVSADFARTQRCDSAGAYRLRWLADECRKLDAKRVLEMGSVDGFSLFQLMNYAPEIQWEGLEVSAAAVAHGNEIAGVTGHPLKLHHAPEGFFDWVHVNPRRRRNYDAAALFEILEHNTEVTNITLVYAALAALAPRGHLFISTPHGNWSAFDEGTRVLELKKDHVRAFTVKRMRRFLTQFPELEVLDVREVQNQTLQEANSWCLAICKKR